MRKKLLALGLLISMALVGCGQEESTMTKVELSDTPVKASSDYSGSSGQTAKPAEDNKKEDTNKDKEPEKDTSSGGTPSIYFVCNANGIGWSAALVNSMQDTFGSGGYEYTFIDGQGDQNIQIEGVKTAIAAKPDCLILDPVSEDGWDDILKEAQDAEVPVLLVDRTISADESLYEGWVGSDFLAEGTNAGKWLAETANGEKMNIVVLQGDNGSAALGRTDGFQQVVDQHDNLKIIAQEHADFDKAKAKALMQDYLDQYDDIDVIVTQNDNMLYGVAELLEEKNIDMNDYTIISFDGEAEAFKYMVDNAKLDLEVECNPLQGPKAEEMVKKILAGETIDKINYVEEGVFTADMAKDEIGNRQF